MSEPHPAASTEGASPHAAARDTPAAARDMRAGEISGAWSVAAGAAAFAVYLALAPDAPGAGDSGELTLVLALRGVPHPPGYPFYTEYGHAFAWLLHALGASWVYAANAWSALGGAVAIGSMHALSARWIAPGVAVSRRARATIALLPVALFGLNPAWTSETTLAEVHSWHVAWVLGVGLAFVSITRALSDTPDMPRRLLLACALLWGIVCGMGLGHHSTSVLVSVPLSLGLIVTLARARRLGPAPLAVAIAAVLAALAAHLRLWPAAHHPGPAVWASLEPTWRSLWEHVTGAQYRFFLGRFSPYEPQRRALIPYVYPFLLAWLPVMAAAVWRSRAVSEQTIAVSLCGAAVLQMGFTFGYGVPDPVPYFLPALALALCATAPLAVELGAMGGRVRRMVLLAGAALGLLALLLAWPWTATALLRRTGLTLLERRVRAMWTAVPFERGFVLWGDDQYHRLRLYQALRDEKPGVEVVNPIALVSPPARRRFVARHGFDPLGGVTLDPTLMTRPVAAGEVYERFISDAGRRLHAESGLPVVRFDVRRGELVPVR